MSVVAGLNNAAVLRLKHTMAAVPKQQLEVNYFVLCAYTSLNLTCLINIAHHAMVADVNNSAVLRILKHTTDNVCQSSNLR